MKTIIALSAFLFSMSALAFSQEGLIKNVVEDDEGIKVVLARQAEKSGIKGIQTVYIQNSQADFNSIKQTLLKAKADGSKVIISKPNDQKFKVMELGW